MHQGDGIAAKHHVITFGNRGVGTSTGSTPRTLQEMAKGAVACIRALGLERVDLHGFSMGGVIAQVIVRTEPQLVRRMILSGTGPEGGEGIKDVTALSHLDTARALLTFQDPKQFLFFTRTEGGRRAGKAFLARLQERTVDRPRRGHPSRTATSSRPCTAGAWRNPMTSPSPGSPYSSPTVTTTGWSRRRTRPTWRDGCPPTLSW